MGFKSVDNEENDKFKVVCNGEKELAGCGHIASTLNLVTKITSLRGVKEVFKCNCMNVPHTHTELFQFLKLPKATECCAIISRYF